MLTDVAGLLARHYWTPSHPDQSGQWYEDPTGEWWVVNGESVNYCSHSPLTIDHSLTLQLRG